MPYFYIIPSKLRAFSQPFSQCRRSNNFGGKRKALCTPNLPINLLAMHCPYFKRKVEWETKGASKTATRQEWEREQRTEKMWQCGNVKLWKCYAKYVYKKSFTRNLLSWLVKMTKYVHIHLVRNCCHFRNLDSLSAPSLGMGQPNQAWADAAYLSLWYIFHFPFAWKKKTCWQFAPILIEGAKIIGPKGVSNCLSDK